MTWKQSTNRCTGELPHPQEWEKHEWKVKLEGNADRFFSIPRMLSWQSIPNQAQRKYWEEKPLLARSRSMWPLSIPINKKGHWREHILNLWKRKKKRWQAMRYNIALNDGRRVCGGVNIWMESMLKRIKVSCSFICNKSKFSRKSLYLILIPRIVSTWDFKP